jgi:hypothetical protein
MTHGRPAAQSKALLIGLKAGLTGCSSIMEIVEDVIVHGSQWVNVADEQKMPAAVDVPGKRQRRYGCLTDRADNPVL